MSAPLFFIVALETVKDLLGEQTRSTSDTTLQVESEYWSDDEIYRYLNDAYIEAAKFSKALEVIELISTTASTATYTLPATVGQVIRVAYDNRKVYPITKWELDRLEHDWEAQTGYVSHYMLTQMNNRRIRLFKAPDVSGGLAVQGGEYGVIQSISDGENTYMFSAEYGEVEDTAGTNWDADFVGEYGLATITGGFENSFEVWATKHPARLTGATERFELPYWSHMGIAFRAAAKALGKYGEQGKEDLADAYNQISNDYLTLLRGHVANRAPERLLAMGRRSEKQRRPKVWETLVEEP